MMKISSKNNPLIMETCKLQSSKYRKEEGRFLIEGIKVVEMALESDQSISRLFVDEEKLDSYDSVIAKARKSGVEIVSITSQVATKLAFGKTTQGIFATVKMTVCDITEAKGALILACEDVGDPGNMGTIIRTADAVGVKSIIISTGCVDIYNDKVIRASMGSVFNVNVIISKNFVEDMQQLKERGYNVACGHLDGNDFFSRESYKKNVLIIGNEARGISIEAENVCQSKWKLPIAGKAESLNAAVAAGIMMYDLMRDNLINNVYM